jgi:predicted double-glycine peptidase
MPPLRIRVLFAALGAAVCLSGASGGLSAASVDIGNGNRINRQTLSFKDLRDRNVIKQAYDYSCGAAALATMITFGLGDPMSEAQAIKEMLSGLDRNDEQVRKKTGFSLLDMQRVAQARGYQAQGFRIGPGSLDQITGPVIVFVRPRGYEHFAILKGVRGDRAYLADPSFGNVRMPLYRFLDMWVGDDGKGIVFAIEPEDETREIQSALNAPGAPLPRPELMSARQLLETSPFPLASPGAR